MIIDQGVSPYVYTTPRSTHTFVSYYYTVSQKKCPKKVYPLFDNNFGKCGPIFKILSPRDL